MKLLTKGNLFGEVQCFMYSVEWQKRGLPHIHILLWLKQRISPDKLDCIISAEIPDPEKDSPLYDIIKANMIHGPCGNSKNISPCMESGSCSKKYPRPFIQETQTGDDGYPKYRRRAPENGGFTVEINGSTLDNRWVVPYNPVLSRTFGAHINVEYCNSVKSIKYICKYITKGKVIKQYLVLKMIMMKSSFMKVVDISAALRLYGEFWLFLSTRDFQQSSIFPCI